MNIFKICTVLFFFTLTVFSQDNVDMRLAAQEATAGLAAKNFSGGWIPPKSKNTSIKGSQYLFKSWAGIYTVVSKAGVMNQILNLNYNINSKKLESYIAKDSVFQYNLDQFDYILKFNNKYKVYNNNQNEGLFLELFNNKKLAFYKEVVLTVEEGVMNPLTQELISENEYVKKDLYYIVVNDKFEKIKLNKKDLLKCLSDKEELIKVYVKDNKLDYASEENVLKILNYYNTI